MFKVRQLPNPAEKISAGLGSAAAGGSVKVIVRVQTAGHVPAGARLRSRIDQNLFTAEIDSSRLADVAADPDVVAISPARRIGPVAQG